MDGLFGDEALRRREFLQRTALASGLAARVAFDVAEHEIVLHGECADCRR